MNDPVSGTDQEAERGAEPAFSVLVVDDEPRILTSIEQLLRIAGYQVVVAADSEQAILRLTNQCFDLVLLDLAMPGPGGTAVLEFVAARELDLAVIVISGTTSVNEATAALRRGAVDFLSKPFGPEELLDCITRTADKLRQKRDRRALRIRHEASERLHRFIVNSSPDLIFVLDGAGRLAYLNQRAATLLGGDGDALIEQPLAERTAPEDRHKIRQLLDQLADGAGDRRQTEVRLLRNGSTDSDPALLTVEITALALFNDDGAEPGFAGSYMVARDISERRHAEEALRRASAHLEQVVNASPAVIYSRSLDPEMPFTFISANVRSVFGYLTEELTQSDHWERLLHPDDRARVIGGLQGAKTCCQVMNQEYRLRCQDGGWRWVRDTARLSCDVAGQPLALVGSWLDNTEAHLLSEQLSYQASHDALTGLFNRYAFEQRLQQVIASASEQNADHALCYLDLDQFKVVNDTCGHVAGDALLRQLARVLQAKMRKQDILARLGGDEFGVLIEHCVSPDARRMAQTLCEAVNEFRFVWNDLSFPVSISIGMVAINAASESFSEALSAADSACYAAKDAGRNRVHCYTEDDAELTHRHRQMQWVARINHALEANRFRLAFQTIAPTLRHADGHHYELLLRMEDDAGRLAPPGEFLPAAERYHLAGRLDHWVVSAAFDWLSANPHHLNGLSLCSINLSGQSLGDERLLAYLVERLKEQPRLPGKLCFEITETAAIANLSHAIRFIDRLKGLGCRFALDDFGSGLSSFAYLKNLPVDFLKIDGAFVVDIVHDPVTLTMVSAINEIGHAMGMETIAEFVENDQILAKLREIGVDYAQGYGIGKPRPLAELIAGDADPAGAIAPLPPCSISAEG